MMRGTYTRGLRGDWLRKKKANRAQPTRTGNYLLLQRCFSARRPHRCASWASSSARASRPMAPSTGTMGSPSPTRSPTTWARRARSQARPLTSQARVLRRTALSRATRTPRRSVPESSAPVPPPDWAAMPSPITPRAPSRVSSTRQTRWPTTRARSRSTPTPPRDEGCSTTTTSRIVMATCTLPARRVAARATCSPRSPRAWGA
mmetsp:Transcript_4754/g.14436  ORF Transcript_4754/g.14436 Transcript_4754/m.14436 type:complete len:204 (+) Transcript_4754:122-733(+)